MYYLLMTAGVFLACAAQVPLKKSALNHTPTTMAYYFNIDIVCGYSMMLLASFMSFISVRNIELKKAAIIESLGYIIILVIDKVFFHEQINKRKLIASFFIILGVIVFNA